MSLDTAFQGSLFASDFLCAAITELPDWQELDDASIEDLEAALGAICDRFPAAASPNESQTEDDLIWPVLARLGWTVSLRQQKPERIWPRGRAGRPAVRGRSSKGPG